MRLHGRELAFDGAILARQEARADAIGNRAEPQVEARRLHLGGIYGALGGKNLLAIYERMKSLARQNARAATD